MKWLSISSSEPRTSTLSPATITVFAVLCRAAAGDSRLMELLLPAFIMLQVVCLASGYPSGAPTGACEDMMPRHTGVTPQTSKAPYTLLINSRTYQPGETITGKMMSSFRDAMNDTSIISFLYLCKISLKCTAAVFLACSCTVTIIGPEYRGVLLETRTGSSVDALGSWNLPPPDTQFLQVRLRAPLNAVCMLRS